ncbi:MAG: GTPase HflX [Candidatus Dormibacteria bacterium]
MGNDTLLSGADPGVGATLHNVIVLGTHVGQAGRQRAEIELDELEELARTLGTTVVDRVLVPLREVNPATYLGGGTVESMACRVAELDRPAVLVNDPLTPRQQRNLEEAWAVPVLDRTEVILAIFARRASTAEGRIQVEMAQIEHVLPRLAGRWKHLERQRGGRGIRGGAGETQIEVDRRLAGQRLKRLRQRLKEMERRRSTQRQARTDVPLPSCALVGYTNAGKSTLLNRLTNSTVLADNLLFATLDPTSRLMTTRTGRRLILTDTVGFIQSLPTELVEAFAATLEEVRQARMLAIVVDGSHPEAESQLETVLDTLASMGCDQPAILVVSKVDRIASEELPKITNRLSDIAGLVAVSVSAPAGIGLREFRDAIEELSAQLPAGDAARRTVALSATDSSPVPTGAGLQEPLAG